MNADAALSLELLERYPDEAARTIEEFETERAAELLSDVPAPVAVQVLRRISPHALRGVLLATAPESLATMIEHLDTDTGARLLRRLPPDPREAALQHVGESRARSLRVLLRHDDDTAGALLDPDVLGLHADTTVRVALDQVRDHPEHARYNIYLTGDEQRLAGVLNLRELMLASPDETLRSVMHRATHLLPAGADRHRIVSHPGWRNVHSLPVVDDEGTYLGAIRYRTLRRLEREIAGTRSARSMTAQALGELFATGATGLLEAVTSSRKSDGVNQ